MKLHLSLDTLFYKLGFCFVRKERPSKVFNREGIEMDSTGAKTKMFKRQGRFRGNRAPR